MRGTSLALFNANGPTLLSSLRIGVHGYSGIGAILYPDFYVRLCRSFAEHAAEAERLHGLLTVADAAAALPGVGKGVPSPFRAAHRVSLARGPRRLRRG